VGSSLVFSFSQLKKGKNFSVAFFRKTECLETLVGGLSKFNANEADNAMGK
jgi:hypothetical protein